VRFLPRTPFPIVPTPLFVIAPSRWKGQTRPETQFRMQGGLEQTSAGPITRITWGALPHPCYQLFFAA